MEPEEIEAIKARFEHELAARFSDDLIGSSTRTPAETIKLVANHFHRAGVPVTRGRMEGDAVVFDVIEPRGHG